MSTPVIQFELVSKKYHLRRNRPRSLRDSFFYLLGNRPTHGHNDGREWLWALRPTSFSITQGETVGLIGANGAGKSTTLKLISKVIFPSHGAVEVTGRVGALLELGAGFHPELSGRDNIYLSAALAGLHYLEIKQKFDAIVDFSELEDFIDVPLKHFSSGMFARLGFAVNIHLDPEVLLIDEVLAVGDYGFQQKCLDRIELLRQQGVTICYVSHALDTVRQLCSRVLWFDRGTVVADGATEDVVSQYLDRGVAVMASSAPERLSEAEHRWGTWRIEITNVSIIDSQGEPREAFSTGEDIQIVIQYCTHQSVASPIFGLGFYRVDGLHIAGPNTNFANYNLGLILGKGSIRYKIPRLPLLEGLYQVSVAVVNQDNTETYDYHDRLYAFRVSNRAGQLVERYGMLTFCGSWEHTNDQED